MTDVNGVNDAFPARLKAAREAADLNQQELAKKAKLQPSAISHFETGTRRPSFDNLRRLARALDVTTDYLLGLDVGESAGHARVFRKLRQLDSEDQKAIAALVERLADRDTD